ncbi:MAG: hemerythrin domain-containing protein [Myxococcales bacterium]|nr:hemerythrin domain-containing protein [Myxococcales bacterium]
MSSAPTIFDVLRETHREVEELFGDVQSAIHTEQYELAEALFQLLSVKLIAAMRAEHAVVYPRFARDAKLGAETEQALLEHDGIERMIDWIRVGGLPQDEWCEAVAKLGTLVADHADCEECTLFPLASLELSSDQLHEIGLDFVQRMMQTTPVAGASITYEPTPAEPPPPVSVTFKPRHAA